MNILFVNKYSDFSDYHVLQYPLGICYVADSLRRAGHNIFWVEFTEKRPSESEIQDIFRAEFNKNNIQCVCCGATCIAFGQLRDIFNAAKAVNPDVYTVGGGALFTHSPKESLECVKSCDYGVIGEGEISSVLLVNALEKGESVESIKGVIYRKNGQILNNGTSEFVMDLENIPYPEVSPKIREYMVATGYGMITASRSCPFGCTFCSLSTAKKYRNRSIDAIIREIKDIQAKYGVTRIEFIDEMFFNQKDFIMEFAERVKPLGITFKIQSRVNRSIDEECVEALKAAGMYHLSCGIENVDDNILKSMKKGQTLEIYERFFEVLQNTGIKSQYIFYILLGDPAETYESIKKNLDYFYKNATSFNNIFLNLLLCFPGSELYQKAVESGLIKDTTAYLETMSESSIPAFVNLTRFSDREMNVLRVILDLYANLVFAERNNDLGLVKNSADKCVDFKCTCGNIISKKDLWILPHIECKKCGNIHFYNAMIRCFDDVGEKIIEMSKTKKIGIWGMWFLFPQILTESFTENKNITLFHSITDQNASDWRKWEEMLDMPERFRMSKMLEEHYCYNKIRDYQNNSELDTVIIQLPTRYFESVKAEILSDNPNINVISANDLYFAD
jgi:radical SAM superfamily enzyme YgiQ (UPF0313 family)